MNFCWGNKSGTHLQGWIRSLFPHSSASSCVFFCCCLAGNLPVATLSTSKAISRKLNIKHLCYFILTMLSSDLLLLPLLDKLVFPHIRKMLKYFKCNLTKISRVIETIDPYPMLFKSPNKSQKGYLFTSSVLF